MKKFPILAVILMLAWSTAVRPQEQPSLKPPASPRDPEPPTLLSLEVRYNSALPPAYTSVGGADVKPRWIWVTRFARISGWKWPQDALPISAVRLESQFNGETAGVRVTLLRGGKTFEQEDLVGVYQLGVGEQKTITRLSSFGIEPFNITLLDSVPPLPPAPIFDNRINTIEVVDLRLENLPLPAYRITFRNLSDKDILALKVDTLSDGRPGVSTLFQGDEGRPLVQSGALVEQYLTVVTAQRTATAYAPGAASSNTIRIRTAVFADGTYEGEEGPACMFESFVVGRRLWLTRVLPLLVQQLAAPNNDQPEAARQFKEKFLALPYDQDETERRKTSSVSATCPNPHDSVEISTQGLKLQLLRELERVINSRPVPPVSFGSWLESSHARYSNWLMRLDRPN